MDFRIQDRMELKALVDFYATESDKNEKIDGRWWICEREQHFEWSTNQTLG